jgi:glycosyltransferase involved in cell wall biosynthesis
MKSINFILPGPSPYPVGGTKVVYEYANQLTKRGYQVQIIHPASMRDDTIVWKNIADIPHFISRYFNKSFAPNSWFPLDPRVRTLWCLSLEEKYVPPADVVIATGWQTANHVAGYGLDKGKKFYLIQHQEIWAGSHQKVMDTWKFPLHKLVIAKWLGQIATELGESSSYVPNGLDFNAFGVDLAPEDRQAHSVFMLFHDQQWKGSNDGIKALELAKNAFPELTATLFGIPNRPTHLPSWINYVQNPAQSELRALYNNHAIFVSPSWAEGWGLPPCEAMMSGAALVATSIGGHLEYAHHEKTALLCEVKNPLALAEALKQLLADPHKRILLAKNGHAHIQQFTWEAATDRLEQFLLAK